MDIGNKDNFIHDRDLRCDGNIDVFKFTVEEFFGKDIEGITQIYQPGVEIDGEDYFATSSRVNYFRNLELIDSDNRENISSDNYTNQRFLNLTDDYIKDEIRSAILKFILSEKYTHIYYIQERFAFNCVSESSLVFECVFGYLVRGLKLRKETENDN